MLRTIRDQRRGTHLRPSCALVGRAELWQQCCPRRAGSGCPEPARTALVAAGSERTWIHPAGRHSDRLRITRRNQRVCPSAGLVQPKPVTQANGGGLAHKLQPAQTETIDLPWKDCEGLVGSASGAKNWVFWHHWPDAKLHDHGRRQGLELLTRMLRSNFLVTTFGPLLGASPLGGAWSLPRITATPPRVLPRCRW